MEPTSVLLALCNLNGNKRKNVIIRAVSEYANILSEIYNDIYESCVKVYYSSYKPVRYKRHGDITGFNLYSAFYSEVHDVRLDAMYQPENLLPYKIVSREDVLNAVINGQRGLEHRTTKHGTWPQSWSAKYPNAFSQYSIWQSSGDTIEAILDDFDQNGLEATMHIYWELLSSYV